jgi:hypothetical protein
LTIKENFNTLTIQQLLLNQYFISYDLNLIKVSFFTKCRISFLSLQVQHYILVVQAQDNGHPSLSSTLTVYCNVIDLNDNAPIFDPMSYSNEIYENVPIRTEVVRVSATDIDSGKSILSTFNNTNES